MTYVMGVDGGKTKTVCLVATTEGKIVGWGRSGPSDIYCVGPNQVLASVGQAVEQALRSGGIGIHEITNVCYGMAGADWPEDVAELTSCLGAVAPEAQLVVTNDAIISLWAGCPEGIGVVINCGTGAAIGARAADGRQWHAGWWIPALGAAAIADEGIRAACDAELGLADATCLTKTLPEFFGVSSVSALLQAVTRRENPLDTMAQGACLVLAAAQEQDETAQAIVKTAGTRLGRYAVAAARHVGLATPFDLALLGGVMRQRNTLLYSSILHAVHRDFPEVSAHYSDLEPAVGALLVALHAPGKSPVSVRSALTDSQPPANVFANEIASSQQPG